MFELIVGTAAILSALAEVGTFVLAILNRKGKPSE